MAVEKNRKKNVTKVGTARSLGRHAHGRRGTPRLPAASAPDHSFRAVAVMSVCRYARDPDIRVHRLAVGVPPRRGRGEGTMGADGVELMNLFWTTAGIFPGDGEISPHDFKDRVEAAARAGFKGIGIWHTDLEHCMLHRSLKEMRRILDGNGMKHVELEFLTDWFLDGGRKAESDTRKARLLTASEALHAKHVKIGDFYNVPCPMGRIVEAFSALCREAEDHGATIGFEVMQCSMIDSLADAITLVETAGAPNGGLILDILQVANLGITHEQIRRIPLRYLVGLELNDGALPGSPRYDPSRARRFCGEGDFDIRGLVACARGIGFAGPWAVEVMSRELTALPLNELNRRAYQTTMSQFAG
jgi:sugar phosphate isomerase/epimerase